MKQEKKIFFLTPGKKTKICKTTNETIVYAI